LYFIKYIQQQSDAWHFTQSVNGCRTLSFFISCGHFILLHFLSNVRSHTVFINLFWVIWRRLGAHC